MTTEVTIENTGHRDINVNECVPQKGFIDQWKNEYTHTLKPREKVVINIHRWKDVHIVEVCSGE